MYKTENEKLNLNIENYSYLKFLTELIKICNIHKINKKIIGFKNIKKLGITNPIYRLILNPKSKKTIVIATGEHGAETGGPLSILSI